MELQLADKSRTIEVSEVVFDARFNESLVHQIVTAYMAGGRAGTQSQKTRAEVRGGGRKPWNQKGGGRARAGTIRSPIWRTGGVVFAAKQRSYEQKVNKKMYRGALRSILSELARLDRLVIVDVFEAPTPKTKDMLKQLNGLGISGNTLIITEAVDENIYLATRNIHTINVCDVAAVDPVALVRAEKVVISAAALKQFEELLK